MSDSTARRLKLGIMAKYWESGRVKTRLGASIGMSAAARVHRIFCEHLAETLRDLANESSFVITPHDRKPEFLAADLDGWRIELQAEGDLGQRMGHWFATPCCDSDSLSIDDGANRDRSAQEPTAPTDRMLIGADCPSITRGVIRWSHRALSSCDVVIVPARDGGYVLIGFRGPWQERYATLMREIPWSSDRVLDVTLARAADAQLQVAVGDPLEDIDTVDELLRLWDSLNTSEPAGVSPGDDPLPAQGQRAAETLKRMLEPYVKGAFR